MVIVGSFLIAEPQKRRPGPSLSWCAWDRSPDGRYWLSRSGFRYKKPVPRCLIFSSILGGYRDFDFCFFLSFFPSNNCDSDRRNNDKRSRSPNVFCFLDFDILLEVGVTMIFLYDNKNVVINQYSNVYPLNTLLYLYFVFCICICIL